MCIYGCGRGYTLEDPGPAGPAAASGIRTGDLLTSADQRPLRTRHDLQLALMESGRRQRAVALELTRGAEPMWIALRALKHTGR
jgi:S1-C subfamily serine protease